MTAVLRLEDSAEVAVLYMALELSSKNWKIGFSNGERRRVVSIEAGDWVRFRVELAEAKRVLRLAAACRVLSCYEAGRDGFWIHRELETQGIENRILDSSSIEVNRRKRRAKNDQVDVMALLRLLQRYWGGERNQFSVVQVPTLEDEDRRRLNRERERLVKERGAHSSRIKALLVSHGVRLELGKGFLERLERSRSGAGYELGPDLLAEIGREYARYELVDGQLKALEKEQKRRVAEGHSKAMEQVAALLLLKGVGWQSSWPLVMEFFAWRAFKNPRQVGACAGLTPTPYASGQSEREQGISKAGSRRVRSLMVELSWLWLRYQPDSALSRWFQQRFSGGGKRMRRIGIVALARKLLVALWRYVTEGVVPVGALMKAS